MTQIDIASLPLKAGAHDSIAEGACLLEAVSYLAGEPWTDHPACVSPVLAALGRSWNDGMRSDEERESLKPYIPRLIGTAGDAAADKRRAWMAADWLVRVHAPAWLRLAGLTKQAERLERLPEITDGSQVPGIKPVIEAVRQDATAALGAAYGAAYGACLDAAYDAAHGACLGAAYDAALDALQPTAADLQASAHDLFDRMIEARS